MLTVHTPIPGSLSFTRSLSSCTYTYIYICIYAYFYLFPRALRKTLSLCRITSRGGRGRRRNRSNLDLSCLLLCRSNQRGGDGQFHRRGENASPSGTKRTGDYSSLLSHAWTRDLSFSVLGGVVRPDTPTTSPSTSILLLFSPLYFSQKERERERKVKSPGGKFLLLFSKVFLSFLLSSMIVERGRGRKGRGEFRPFNERERERKDDTTNHESLRRSPFERVFPCFLRSMSIRRRGRAAGERRLAKKKKDWSEHGRETRGGEVSK